MFFILPYIFFIVILPKDYNPGVFSGHWDGVREHLFVTDCIASQMVYWDCAALQMACLERISLLFVHNNDKTQEENHTRFVSIRSAERISLPIHRNQNHENHPARFVPIRFAKNEYATHPNPALPAPASQPRHLFSRSSGVFRGCAALPKWYNRTHDCTSRAG